MRAQSDVCESAEKSLASQLMGTGTGGMLHLFPVYAPPTTIAYALRCRTVRTRYTHYNPATSVLRVAGVSCVSCECVCQSRCQLVCHVCVCVSQNVNWLNVWYAIFTAVM